MIERARKQSAGMNISYEQASADSLPVAPQSADLALSTMVFHHLPLEVKRGTLQEAKRILKSGGEFLLCDFSWNDYQSGLFYRLVKKLRFAILMTIEPEVRPQLEGQLFDLAREQGGTIEQLWTKGLSVGMHTIRFPS